MPKYSWVCLNKRILYMYRVLNMSKLWIWQSFEYDRVLKMRGLRSGVNMPEYALTDSWSISSSKYARFWNIAGFWIC